MADTQAAMALADPLSRNAAALDFLSRRRSRPAKTLGTRGPDRAELSMLLTLAARAPDHGKLEPWRFVALERPAMARIATIAGARAAALGQDAVSVDKAVAAFGQGAVVVAVLASPKPSPKIPEWEQLMSVGAVCLGLLNAALAAGWGANWLSGWMARDAEILRALGATGPEFVAGFIHIGEETAPPPERPRPDIAALTTYLEG